MNNKEILRETLNNIKDNEELIVIVKRKKEGEEFIEFNSTETEFDKQIGMLELAKNIIVNDTIKEDK